MVYTSPRAPVDPSNPEPPGYCDRCNAKVLHRELQWQYQWAGPALVNTGYLVCHRCLDAPNDQFRTIVIGPDPVPVQNARPGYITSEEGTTPVFNVGSLIPD